MAPWPEGPWVRSEDYEALKRDSVSVSALLSDEVVEALAKFEFDRLERESDIKVVGGPQSWGQAEPAVRGELLGWARSALEAAIQQVGGGQGGR